MIKKIYKSILSEAARNKVRKGFRNAVAPLYYGSTYKCNCCNASFRKLLDKGGRKNAECPRCGSLERTRLLLFYLEKETRVFEKSYKVLHFAPEPGLYNKISKSDCEYIDADIHPAYANHIVDITDIQYPDYYFDLIICSHVVAHVSDEDKALEELKRVLSLTGKAILMTYINPDSYETIDHDWINTPNLRQKHYGEPDCLRLHGGDFGDRLRDHGFKVSQIDYRHVLGEEKMKKYALGEGPREWIFECFK